MAASGDDWLGLVETGFGDGDCEVRDVEIGSI
jgi:hypothetical protein